MSRIAIYCFLVLAALEAAGQPGFSLSYRTFESDEWKAFLPSNGMQNYAAGDGFQASLGYLFPLSQVNLKTGPELSFGHYERLYGEPARSRHETYSLNWTSVAYPFDIQGKCDCPTFSKPGNTFSKGLFLQFSPGAWYRRSTYSDGAANSDSSQGLTWLAGGGLGLDIGIQENLTFSPFLLYFHGWDSRGGLPTGTQADQRVVRQFSAGFRVGFP